MVNEKYLGEFETLVLIALLRLGNDAYGVSIRREIEARAGRSVLIGSVYAALERLEAKGLVRSRLGEATARRGGRRKKHFVITAGGEARLRDTMRGLRRMICGTRIADSLSRVKTDAKAQ